MQVLSALLDDTLLDMLDTDGRPLGEQASDLAAGVTSEIVRCPFAGDRLGGDMNVTAWRQVADHWPQVLATLAERSGPTASDAWRSTCRSRWAVLGLQEPLSTEVAATFKTALGLHRPLTAWLLAAPELAGEPLEALCPGESLLERLDEQGWLVGSRQVCAGPPHRIVEAWQALGSSPTPSSGPDIADRATELVVGAWALLGATRAAVRSGRLDEVPDYSPVGPSRSGWPEVLDVLRRNGPTALVREVPRFEPEWSLRVFSDPPPAVLVAVRHAQAAADRDRPFAHLDQGWRQLREATSL